MHYGRIVHGQLKKRKILLPQSIYIRPTTDAIKEMIFNVLLHKFYINFVDTIILDIFAGSGALGIEALSLGASYCFFYDNNKLATNCIQKNLSQLGLIAKSKVLCLDASDIDLDFLSQVSQQHILILLDPPYRQKQLLLDLICRIYLLDQKNIIIIIETNFDIEIKGIEFAYKKQYNQKKVFFMKN